MKVSLASIGTKFTAFIRNESGAVAIEYGLFAALIAVGIITAVGNIGGTLSDTFDKVDTSLTATVAP